MQPHHKRHRDDDIIDEITMRVVPRYKTSGLSGDEWRVSTYVDLRRKGDVMFSRSYSDMETAAAHLPWVLKTWCEDAGQEWTDRIEKDRSTCHQPGCAEPATVVFKLKKEYSREGFERAEHLGAAGSERGRDVIAWRGDELWAFQCKRVKRFGPQNALKEIEKVATLPEAQRPTGLVFVVTCNVTDNTRQKARERCADENLDCQFWASTELDERVKRYADIVQEFFRAGQGSSSAGARTDKD